MHPMTNENSQGPMNIYMCICLPERKKMLGPRERKGCNQPVPNLNEAEQSAKRVHGSASYAIGRLMV